MDDNQPMPVISSDAEDLRLSECKTDSELSWWAQKRLLAVIADHPNEDDRQRALLALGLLVGMRR